MNIKTLFVAGAVFLLSGCNSSSPTAPLQSRNQHASWADCESRTGYFVRSGRDEHYSDSACLVEIPQ